jgi:amino acid transporter
VGGAALTLIALVMANLGGARPKSGGLIRWPFYSSGRLMATIAGWHLDRVRDQPAERVRREA